MTATRRQPLAEWVILVFLIVVVGAGMFLGKDDPDTPWGPIILGAFGLMALVVRAIFKIPAGDNEDDGYVGH
jgi:hypothetical protein